MKKIIVFLVLSLVLAACATAPAPASEAAALPTSTSAPPPTATPAPTNTPAPTPVPTLGVGSQRTAPLDGMPQVYVPGGTFQMGSRDSNGVPVHEVTLSAFWIDRTEVSNAQYAQCVAAGACQPPKKNVSQTRTAYYDVPEFANYPVVFVSWENAGAYCAWAGRRLPTEAEWEYAARGADGRPHPWGDQPPSCDLLNYASSSFLPGWQAWACIGDTAPVDAYPAGASPFGALNMAGNVYEWVADWYGRYPEGPQVNPTGPETGGAHVMRGPSFHYITDDMRMYHSAFRQYSDAPSEKIGFRCASSE